MKQQDYNWSDSANVSAKEAFKGISRVSDWWAKNFEGSAQNLNDTFAVNFGETKVNFRISEFVTDKKVIWHVTDCYLPWLKDKTEWTGTDVIWEISENSNNSTQIKFTHAGLVPEIECYENCERGWNKHKDSLMMLLTQNAGFPS